MAAIEQNADSVSCVPIRRKFLGQSVTSLAATAAGVGALALPAGAPAELVDADPDLAAIEEGYRNWQELQAEKQCLRDQRDELLDRARAERPAFTPAPSVDDFETYRAFLEADREWRRALPDLKGHPDYEASHELDAQAEEHMTEALELRKRVLAIPTNSLRGLLIKLAIAAEAETVERIETVVDELGMELGFPVEDLLAALLADLRADGGATVRRLTGRPALPNEATLISFARMAGSPKRTRRRPAGLMTRL
jgi:hypothetical protein